MQMSPADSIKWTVPSGKPTSEWEFAGFNTKSICKRWILPRKITLAALTAAEEWRTCMWFNAKESIGWETSQQYPIVESPEIQAGLGHRVNCQRTKPASTNGAGAWPTCRCVCVRVFVIYIYWVHAAHARVWIGSCGEGLIETKNSKNLRWAQEIKGRAPVAATGLCRFPSVHGFFSANKYHLRKRHWRKMTLHKGDTFLFF